MRNSACAEAAAVTVVVAVAFFGYGEVCIQFIRSEKVLSERYYSNCIFVRFEKRGPGAGEALFSL